MNYMLLFCIALPSWVLTLSSSLPGSSTSYSVDVSDPSYPPSDSRLMWEANLIMEDAYVKSVEKQVLDKAKAQLDQGFSSRHRSLKQASPQPSALNTTLQESSSISIEPNTPTQAAPSSLPPNASELFAEYQQYHQYLQSKESPNNTVSSSNGPIFQHLTDFLHGDNNQPAPAPIVVVPIPQSAPQPQPQQQLGPQSTPQQGQGGPTIVGSGGIHVVTSNPISLSNPIDISNPNVNGQVNKFWGGRKLRG